MHVEHPTDPVAGDRLHSLGVPYLPVLQAAPEQLLQLESQLVVYSHRCVSGESQSQLPPKKPSQLQLFLWVSHVCPSLRGLRKGAAGCAREQRKCSNCSLVRDLPAIATTPVQPSPIACTTDFARRDNRRMRREGICLVS